MSDNFILRRVLDPFFSPSPIIDELGHNAYAKTKLGKTLSRPDVIIPFLSSVSAIAISSYFSTPTETLELAKDVFAGTTFTTTVNLLAESLYKPLKSRCFIDRTRKPLHSLDPSLESRFERQRNLFAIQTGQNAVIVGLVNSMITEPFLMAAGGAFIYQSAHKAWRAHRALTEEWSVHTSRPDKAPKTPPSMATPTPA